MANQLKIGFFEQVRDVCFLTGEEIIQADDIVSRFDQPFTEVRAEKASTPGDQDSLRRLWGGHAVFSRMEEVIAGVALLPPTGAKTAGAAGGDCPL